MNLRQTLTLKLLECKLFLRFVVQHFVEDDCTYRASALAFTSLLAIVPFMSVVFAILSTFPVFQDLTDPMQNFIFTNFVPTTGKVIQQYLQVFSAQISKLSTIGVIFLFIIAILVMFTTESSMNKIWRVNKSRHGVSAFLLYWAIISLAPFLLGLSLVVSSYFASSPLFKDIEIPTLLNIVPFLCSLAGFTFLYVVVPNCKVEFLHGLYGGAFAAVLFESVKLVFAYYITHYNFYQLLYGAFAALPMFIIWIYWVWFITLLGAEVSYALSMHHQRRPGQRLDGFSHALLWLYELRLSQRQGKGLTIEELIDKGAHAYEVDASTLLNQLTKHSLIKPTMGGHYFLVHDLNELTLYELSRILPYPLPSRVSLTAHTEPLPNKLFQQLENIDDRLRNSLNISLEDIFISNPA